MTKQYTQAYFGGVTQTTEWLGNSGRNYTGNYFGGVQVPPDPNDNFIPPDANSPLAWVTKPATGTVGDQLKYVWQGGDISQPPKAYNVVVATGSTIIDDKTAPDLNYTFDTTGKAAGAYTVTVYDKGGKGDPTAASIVANLTLAAAPVVKSISGKTVASATGGDTVTFANLFTVANCGAGDFDYAVNPTSAGSVNTTSGLLTLVDNATGKVEVTATAKSATGAVTGSPAKATITAVAPKKTVAGKTIAAATGGDVIQFATMFTATNCGPTDFNFAVDGTPANGTVDATTGALTLIDAATGTVKITATGKAAGINGSPAVCTITAVTPKP